MADKKSKPVMQFEDVYQMTPVSEFEDVMQEQPQDMTGVPKIPTKQTTPTVNKDKSKLVEFISGGKASDWTNFLYGGETPAETPLGKASQLLQQSGIEGLTGIAPVGQVGSAISTIGSNIPSAARVVSAAEKSMPNLSKVVKSATAPVSAAAEKATQYVKDLPLRYLSYQSKVPSQNIKAAYNIGREQNPSVVESFKNIVENTDFLPQNVMQYNYSRTAGLPPDWASRATHMGYENENATWNLLNEFLASGGQKFPVLDKSIDFAKLSDADKIKYAKDVGMSVSSVKPMTKSGRFLGGAEGGLAAALESGYLFPAMAKAAPILAVNAAAKSPYVVGKVAYGAGKTANIANKYFPPFLSYEIPAYQALGLTGLLGRD